MIGMMDDMRFLTERRHEALLAEAEARRLAKGSRDDVEDELSTKGRGPAKAFANATVIAPIEIVGRTHTRALRAVHTAAGNVADRHGSSSATSEAPYGGASPETCSEGRAAAA